MFDVIGLLLQEGLFFLGYVTGRSEFPKQLPRAEEEALVRRMAEGDDNARQVLITHNLRLVSHIARKYTVPGHGQDDLISIGVIGLIKAVNSYKPGSGTALGTYAARCIENEILMYFRSQKKLQGEVSLSDSIDSDADGDSLQLMDVVGVEDTMLEDLHDRDSALRVRQLVRQKLSPREAEIIRLRYGLGGTVPLTQREVAATFGISRSYVSRRH